MTAKVKKLFEETIAKLKGVEDAEEIGAILSEFEAKLPKGQIKDWFDNLGGGKDTVAKVEKMMKEVDALDKAEALLESEKVENTLKELAKIVEKSLEQLKTPPKDVPEEIIKVYKKLDSQILVGAKMTLELFKMTSEFFKIFSDPKDID